MGEVAGLLAEGTVSQMKLALDLPCTAHMPIDDEMKHNCDKVAIYLHL